MLLRTRPAHIDEIPDLFARFGQTFAYREEIRPHVPRVWQQLLLEERIVINVFEDLDRPTSPAIGLEVRAFVTPEFFYSHQAGQQPYAGNRIVEAILAGHDPVLTRAQMRQAHRGDGLHCFMINDPIGRTPFTNEELAQVDLAWTNELDTLTHVNLKEVALELYGGELLAMAEHCGTVRRNEFAEFWEANGAQIGPELRPYIVGMNQEEATLFRGTHMAQLFARRWPRLALTRPQQELLQLAIQGQTDQELADSLYISLSAVKKRWTAIYASVDIALPGLLPSASFSEDTARGTEKRRYLLNYLRDHREELESLNAAERTQEPATVS